MSAVAPAVAAPAEKPDTHARHKHEARIGWWLRPSASGSLRLVQLPDPRRPAPVPGYPAAEGSATHTGECDLSPDCEIARQGLRGSLTIRQSDPERRPGR